MIEIEWQGQAMRLLPDRALLLPESATLVIADWHLGKSHIFRQHGISVPRGSTAGDLDRIDRLLALTHARELAVLGDLLHGPVANDAPWLARWRDWRRARGALRIRVAAGNHDRQVDSVSADLDECAATIALGRLIGVHQPGTSSGPEIAGHVHPYRKLRAPGISERVPVFYLRERTLVLPAFGRFTGGETIRPAPGERTFAALPDAVVAL